MRPNMPCRASALFASVLLPLAHAKAVCFIHTQTSTNMSRLVSNQNTVKYSKIWANVTKHFLGFVNKFSFCYHSTIKKILWNSFYLMVANSEKKPTIFDLTFDTHDNPGDIFKIYKWFWNFFIPHLLVWTGAKNTSKTQHFLMCFCCVLHQNPPRFFKWGG